ncbi:MAG: hypothetical protein ACOCPN_01550 [Desulfonatronovibrionaceae bacterium]
MRLGAKQITLLVLTGLGLTLWGCSARQAEHFLWPDSDDPYLRITRKWSASRNIYSGLETRLIAHVTYKSPDWTRAYARKKARVYGLDPEETQESLQIFSRHLEEETEFFVSLYSPQPKATELGFKDSAWKVYLQTAQGRREPLEIREVHQSLVTLQPFFPYVEKWHQNYVLRFPGSSPESAALVLTGPQGRAEFIW